ncbi:MAG: hypothetical protein LBE62_09095 [Azonexus sp.]|nr:hypothetical protein [Azonexus sp.]
MSVLSAYGLLAQALIFGAAVALLPFGLLRSHAGLIATAVALFGGIAPILHGLLGTPSLTLLQLALLQLANRPSPLKTGPALALLGLAVLFYPLLLAWEWLDLYAIGYQPWPLLAAALALLAAVLWRRRQDLWLVILAVDLAGYASGLFVNLWDALLDPLLVLLAALVAGRALLRRFIVAKSH